MLWGQIIWDVISVIIRPFFLPKLPLPQLSLLPYSFSLIPHSHLFGIIIKILTGMLRNVLITPMFSSSIVFHTNVFLALR